MVLHQEHFLITTTPTSYPKAMRKIGSSCSSWPLEAQFHSPRDKSKTCSIVDAEVDPSLEGNDLYVMI
jgi:hypothetical protein